MVFFQTAGVQRKADHDVLIVPDVQGIQIFTLFIKTNNFHVAVAERLKENKL